MNIFSSNRQKEASSSAPNTLFKLNAGTTAAISTYMDKTGDDLLAAHAKRAMYRALAWLVLMIVSPVLVLGLIIAITAFFIGG